MNKDTKTLIEHLFQQHCESIPNEVESLHNNEIFQENAIHILEDIMWATGMFEKDEKKSEDDVMYYYGGNILE